MASPVDLETVSANGLEFACHSEGDGPLVLLLHGFPDTARSWDATRRVLAENGFRAVSPYMRGYDPTAIPKRDTDARTLAEDTVGLLEALSDEPAFLVGHDWGAMAAYGGATLSPGRVRKLVTIAIPHPAALRPTPGRLWAFRHFIQNKLPGAARRFARNDFAGLRNIYKRWSPLWDPSDEEFADVVRCFSSPDSLDAAFGYYRALSFVVPKFLLEKISVDTVVFWGQSDALAFEADYHYAARRFTADYQLESLPGGHFMHREHRAPDCRLELAQDRVACEDDFGDRISACGIGWRSVGHVHHHPEPEVDPGVVVAGDVVGVHDEHFMCGRS